MAERQNIYFLSDAHLGVPDHAHSLEREKKLVQWLKQVAPSAKAIYLVGDIFDFWFEYKHVVPRGYVRLFGTIAGLTDNGLPVHFLPGNHDLWVRDYFHKEMGMQLHCGPISEEFNGKTFYIAHGDGLGNGDKGYKLLKKLFTCKLCRWLFAQLHPDLAIRIASSFSHQSRINNTMKDEVFSGENNECLVTYAKKILQTRHYDYFIFGHRHLPLEINLPGNSRFINLGEWYHRFTYGVFDGENFRLEYFDD
ncbi:MAG: UDP-2,3-diacylglucosamine diphosphatase [Bacteroidales bacterium]